MNKNKKILFITNGHGEDAVALEIIKHLSRADATIQVSALPLVGSGEVFKKKQINVIGNPKNLPSGGFSFRNLKYFWQDLRSGLLSNLFKNIGALINNRREFDLVIGVGDIISLIFSKFIRAPFIFVGVNKSSYYTFTGYDYTFIEKWLMKKCAKKVYARDALTQEEIKNEGIEAEFVGNPLMDTIDFELKLDINPNKTYISLLPGSHDDAGMNLDDLIEVARTIKQLYHEKEIEFLVPAPPSLHTELLDTARKNQNLNPQDKQYPNVKILNGHFGASLQAAKIVIGLAGTANEQAVGLLKPVVSFPGRGSQYTQKFAEAQKQLLGKGLMLTTKEKAAQMVTNLLKNEAQIARMTEEGKNRMVKSDACEKIAQYLVDSLFSS